LDKLVRVCGGGGERERGTCAHMRKGTFLCRSLTRTLARLTLCRAPIATPTLVAWTRGVPHTELTRGACVLLPVSNPVSPRRMTFLGCVCSHCTQVRLRIAQKRRQMFGSRASSSMSSAPPGEKLGGDLSQSSRHSSGGCTGLSRLTTPQQLQLSTVLALPLPQLLLCLGVILPQLPLCRAAGPTHLLRGDRCLVQQSRRDY
jgi:hypothetical protein